MKVAKAEMECLECGNNFIANRVDQQFCTGRCKSKNFRRVQKEKLNLLERLFDRLPNQQSTVKRDLFAA
jgi:Zn finger protein HypA/HybF involved in hydrogenase expression